MSRVRTILFCLVGLMLVGLGLGLFRFHHLKKAPQAALALLPGSSDVSLNRVHHVATRDGAREWILDAESVTYRKPDNRSILKGVSVTFFLRSGETVQVTGSEGVFNTETKDMDLSGHVVVQSGAYQLKTDRLHYDHESRSVTSSTPIVVEGDRVHLTGKTMLFSFLTEQATVDGSVQAVLEGAWF